MIRFERNHSKTETPMTQVLTMAAVAAFLALPAGADIVITDAYARASNPKAGAGFMVIENTGPKDDRLVAVSSEAAARTELHSHRETPEGVMRMLHLEEGIALPAGARHRLARGGDHVMFMGLVTPMEQGQSIAVTLHFESGAEQQVTLPVDLDRAPEHGAGAEHGAGHASGAGHGAMGHGNAMGQGGD